MKDYEMTEYQRDAIALIELNDKSASVRLNSLNCIAQSKKAEINDDVSLGKASDLKKIMVSLQKASNSTRLSLTKQHRDIVKVINDWFKDSYVQALDEAVIRLNGNMKNYLFEKQAKERIRLNKIRMEAEELARKEAELNKEDVSEKIEEVKEVMKVVEKRSKVPVRGAYGSSTSTRTVKKYRITDLSKVRTKYLMVNDAAIKKGVANDADDLDGIEVYEDIIITTR